MTETQLKSPANAQKSTYIAHKCPKIILNHLYMIKILLGNQLNGQKAPQNVEMMQKNSKNGKKQAKNLP